MAKSTAKSATSRTPRKNAKTVKKTTGNQAAVAITKSRPARKPTMHDVKKPKPRPKKVIPVPVIPPTRTKLLQARLKKLLRTKRSQRLKKILKHPRTKKWYAIICVLILIITTIIWALASSHLQQANADQLINALLFHDTASYKGAVLPAQHSFLIKWPLLLLVKAFGYSAFGYQLVTVGTVLLTVLGLAWVLYKIERRPLVFGTLCLALASILLQVPAQPYAGALLPVGMGMLMTRNLEYMVYIAALALLLRPGRRSASKSALALLFLGVLIVSDHLFLSVSLGSAVLFGIVSILQRQRATMQAAGQWLAASLLAIAISLGLATMLTAYHITSLVGSGGLGPYGITHTFKQLVLGLGYGVSSIFTNLGANPAYDATVISHIPQRFVSHLISLDGPNYLINICLLIGTVGAVYTLLRSKPINRPTLAPRLSLALVCSVVTACGLFVVSNHYYAVDARYLGIAPFAAIIVLATVLRTRKLQSLVVAATAVMLVVSCMFGVAGTLVRTHQAQQVAQPFIIRQQKITTALKLHKVSTLVGDYWRVVPVKAAHPQQNVLPLADCTHPLQALISKNWNVDLHKHSFAYLLSFDDGRTDFATCSQKQILAAYGRPNSTLYIAGTIDHPQEVLLFYDKGIRVPSKIKRVSPPPSTILPVGLSSLSNTRCDQPTVMDIAAHEDDDLLFMNPDLQHAITSGDCIRSVYLTAGDAGNDGDYWRSREQGTEAAYNSMLGRTGPWNQRIVAIAANEYVRIASPDGNDKISLIFMRLPDGNLDGRGFRATNYESLSRLHNGSVTMLHSVDTQSIYTAASLTQGLTALMQRYEPSEVHTQSSLPGTMFIDHADHRQTGHFAGEAFQGYLKTLGTQPIKPILKYYAGYPIRELQPNIDVADFNAKEAAFLAYSQFDGSVCHDVVECNNTPTYGSYLARQYSIGY